MPQKENWNKARHPLVQVMPHLRTACPQASVAKRYILVGYSVTSFDVFLWVKLGLRRFLPDGANVDTCATTA